MYLGLLDASHPAKEEWTKMLALKTANESFAALANRYFDPTYGSGFYSLVPGLVYYKDTGLAIYTGKLKRGGAFPNFPRVYTKTLTPNLIVFLSFLQDALPPAPHLAATSRSI